MGESLCEEALEPVRVQKPGEPSREERARRCRFCAMRRGRQAGHVGQEREGP